ncbi:hypothetical protein [Aureliella helgolandensis]|uniref:Phage major tail protein 2 n=1 Tax=Aureliella helgolandensis TaxID=2527968 RepID=A0A518G4B3_9BACT|nr:hypothetical protein [Aureliella helgolandensis]QDV23431.1 hypothetical protein Q31a_17290 [Aureliella helgolandensis]
MSDNVGRLAKLYINVGTYDSISASEVKRVSDVDIDLGKATEEIDTRETPNTKTVRGNKKLKISFSYYAVDGSTDPVFAALNTSFWTDSNLDMFAMEAAIATVGTKGIRGPFGVTTFDRKEPVNGKIRYEVELEEVCEEDDDTPLYADQYVVPGP